MPCIFEYLDYRRYIRDFLKERKREATHFSQRYLHRRIGVSESSGFISNVIAGKKNLTVAQVQALSKIMRLSRAEAAFFEDLVMYNQVRRAEEKGELFKRLANRQQVQMKRLRPDQLSLFSQWYNVFIRELLAFFPIKDNFDEAGAMLDPCIKGAEVKEALDNLERIGLVTRGESGVYRQNDSFVSTGDEVRSVDLVAFQMHTMDMGKRTLQTVKAAERDIGVVSCALSNEGFAEAKELMREFRKRLLKIAENDRDPRRVYQCNVQFFPVTKSPQADK